MPSFERATETGIVSLYYEQEGEGFPLLLIAPGGMRSNIGAWLETPWNPIRELSQHFTIVAMDQRNAGRSTGPITADDGWQTYTNDQLALMNHLGHKRFHVAGMCIGGTYIGNLIKTEPERIASVVVFQTIGLEQDNRDAFYKMFDEWSETIKPHRPDVKPEAWQQFKANMYGSDLQYFAFDDEDVASMSNPTMILMGDDLYHPASASRTWANSAPNARLVESWKQDPARKVARGLVTEFLVTNTPRR